MREDRCYWFGGVWIIKYGDPYADEHLHDFTKNYYYKEHRPNARIIVNDFLGKPLVWKISL